MMRVIKIFLIVTCVALLALGAVAVATMPQKGIPLTAGTSIDAPAQPAAALLNPQQIGKIRNDVLLNLPATPATWFGLAASLAGTLTFWISVMWLARKRRY